MNECRCRGTGWVKASIPAVFQHEYRGKSWGWAACDTHKHLLNIDSEPPENETDFPDPKSYDWETAKWTVPWPRKG